MSDFYDDQAAVPAESKPLSDPSPSSTPDSVPPVEPAAAAGASDILPPDPPAEDPVVTRFKSCRWYETQEGDRLPDYCSNRDVLPFAGKNGFKPDAWCAECELFKVKRTTKKRTSVNDWDDL